MTGVRVACALLIAASAVGVPIEARTVCTGLARLALPAASITLAQDVAAGAFALPDAAPTKAARALPAFCRVAATLKPTAASDIKIEVWLPASGWTGRFQAVGNGAFSGAIAYPAMMTALARGDVAASTDTGHVGGSASFALDSAERLTDFGWRAVHEMTVAAKRLIAAHYQTPVEYAYWNGCSAGGRQGMKEAQQFPADFDGIVAGSPGLDWTSRATQAVRVAKVLENNPAGRLTPPLLQLLHRGVLDACDPLDGATDGLIENPERCAFEPAVLQCRAGASASCLTPAQVQTARLMYSSPKNPKSGREITGLAPGSELGWTDLGWSASARATGLDQFRYIVFKNPSWTIQQFEFDRDVVRAEETDANTINALEPNLKAFLARGKLLQYHGWSDPQISPLNSTQYYRRVVGAMGGVANVDSAYRLFMVPGMAHCRGGEGPDTFDALGALERWVEQGIAPDRLLASHSANGVVDRTRPLCAFPKVAVYQGRGSLDDAANFVCQTQ